MNTPELLSLVRGAALCVGPGDHSRLGARLGASLTLPQIWVPRRLQQRLGGYNHGNYGLFAIFRPSRTFDVKWKHVYPIISAVMLDWPPVSSDVKWKHVCILFLRFIGENKTKQNKTNKTNKKKKTQFSIYKWRNSNDIILPRLKQMEVDRVHEIWHKFSLIWAKT